jgi:hypothetical protein
MAREASEWTDDPNLTELGRVDEADAYEVDQAAIYIDERTGLFILRTASGCSCWDGDCLEERFPTLDELEYALLGDTTRDYNPTLKGAEDLIAQARAALAKR